VTRGLIVNGDDFGLTPGVNAGILECHARGILTSASLFANAPATAAAIDIALRTPTLGVGCHLTLVDGRPILPADQLPTLAPDSAFRHTWGSFIAAACRRQIDSSEVERELAAQIAHLTERGITLTHLDGHKHVHAYPPVFAIVARLAREFGVPAVRVPWEASPFRLLARYALTPVARRQALENLALTPWAHRDRRLASREALRAPAFAGRTLTGLFAEQSLARALDVLAPGVTELMTHPGYPDADLLAIRTRLRNERADEVSALTSERIADQVRRAGIVLMRHDGASGQSPATTRYA
jgi:hopanoid biosynthesis associated protein HpnK